MADSLSYKKTGVNIDVADATKKEMAKSIDTDDKRVFSRLGAFASLVEGDFSNYRHPILVLKTEEPGSKQKLAFQYNRIPDICHDMINHLINDIIVMGAQPLYVQDCIICGKIDPDVVSNLVASIAEACRLQDCVLVGGETSEQPGVVDAGLYVLSASLVGVVDKEKIIDGSQITEGNVVLAVASNGPHTNGYTLLRTLIDQVPEILNQNVNGKTFIDAIMTPHKCYWQDLKGLFASAEIKGLAHITGGGIEGNLNRILPENLDADIDVGSVKVPEVFRLVRDFGKIADSDMMRTFNMGVGLTLVCQPESEDSIRAHFSSRGISCYPIGRILKGSGTVNLRGEPSW